MAIRKRSWLASFLLLAFAALVAAQSPDPHLAPFAPVVGKQWRGQLAAPDGSASFATECRFESVWEGRAIRLSRSTPALDSFEEGWIYWDDVAKKPAFFSIQSRGVVTLGFVTVEDRRFTFEGQMTWPTPPPNPAIRQRYEIRNTLELTTATAMTDRWFQNAFGPWQPGHVIAFEAAAP